MQFTIRRQYLVSLLDKAWSASVGGLLATTKGFHFAKSGEHLRVVRLDKIIGAVASTNVVTWLDNPSPQEFLVDADKLMRLIKSLTCEDIEMGTTDGKVLFIRGGEFSAKWNLFDLTDFPCLPSYETRENQVTISVKDFVLAVERVKAFTSAEALSVAYKQIYFENESCWGSDGYNYQMVKTNIALPKGVIAIPLIGLDVVKFLKLSGVTNFDLSWDDNFFYFYTGADLFICKRSQVEPPSAFVDFFSKMALESHKSPHFTFDVTRMEGIVERVAITGSSTQKKVLFTLQPALLTVKGVDEDGNVSQEDLVVTMAGEKVEKTIGVHYEMFLKALHAISLPAATLFLEKDHIKLTSENGIAVLPLLKK